MLNAKILIREITGLSRVVRLDGLSRDVIHSVDRIRTLCSMLECQYENITGLRLQQA